MVKKLDFSATSLHSSLASHDADPGISPILQTAMLDTTVSQMDETHIPDLSLDDVDEPLPAATFSKGKPVAGFSTSTPKPKERSRKVSYQHVYKCMCMCTQYKTIYTVNNGMQCSIMMLSFPMECYIFYIHA